MRNTNKSRRIAQVIFFLGVVLVFGGAVSTIRFTTAVLSDQVSSNVARFTVGTWQCTYTLGYWKTHTATWPVTEIMLGGVNYTQPELITLLQSPAPRDITIVLAHQLIAAKLNVANGADGSVIASVVTEADAWLIEFPLFSNPRKPERDTGSVLADTLDDYNNGLVGPGHCDN